MREPRIFVAVRHIGPLLLKFGRRHSDTSFMFRVLSLFAVAGIFFGLAAGAWLYYNFFFASNSSPVPLASRPIIQYNDHNGKLYFVDSLDKVPDEFRQNMREDLPQVNRADYKIPEYLKERQAAKAKEPKRQPRQQQRSTCPLRR